MVPAGLGIAGPHRRDGAYVRGGRCSYPLRTREPTGLVELAAGRGASIGDLFALLGQPLTRSRLGAHRGPVRVWRNGRPWRGEPGALPLRPHDQVVVVAGTRRVPVHATYRFPPGILMRARLLAVVLLAVLSAPAAARADGDPASDVLLGQDVFYPYAPNTVSKPVRGALDAMVAEAKAKGYGVKVALIAAAPDLGAYPYLLTEPQKYADLLTREITFNTKPRVLTVLPSGIGGQNLGDDAGSALSGIEPDPEGGADGLARTAMVALGKLAEAEGKPIAIPAEASAASDDSGGRGGGTSPLLIFGAPVLLVVIAAAVAARLSARHADDGPDDDSDDATPAGSAPGTPT